jgi:hypothetical protein
MTERANPSVSRPLEAYKTAGAIALASGSKDGWISPSDETSDISIQDPAIDEGSLNQFEENSTNSSFDITISPGEGFVFGSWVVKDTETTVSLAPSTVDQTVYLGWNNNEANDVVIGLRSAFNTESNDMDQKIPLYDYTTDSSGVTSVTDRRVIGKLIESSAVEISEKLGLPVYEESVNASAEQGSAIYIDGNGPEQEGIYLYTGSNWDRVARSTEEIEDIIDALLEPSGGITLSYDDTNSTLTIDGATQYTDEQAQDAINALLVSGNAIDLNYDDAGDSLTVSVPSGAIQTDEIDESIAPTWTGSHTFSNTITQSSSPTADDDVATKSYVDANAQGLLIKDSVAVGSTSNIDLTSTTDPNPIDDYTLSDGERILLKDQSDATTNGIYDAVTATDPSTWTRSADADEDAEVSEGLFTLIENGTVQQGQGYVLLNNPTLGTDPLNFTQFSDSGTLSAGDALTKSADTINHADTSSQSDVSAASGSAVTDINFDDYGHTTSASTTDFDSRYVEAAGDTVSGDLTITGSIDASNASEIVSATFSTYANADGASLSEGAIVYISDEEALYLQQATELVEIPTFEVVKAWVNNQSSVPEADVAKGFEARTSYPSNPDSGRVVFRTDKT